MQGESDIMNKKYEYKFVNVDYSPWSGKPKEDYAKIVSDYANDGWRLKQLFQSGGYTSYALSTLVMVLIFEREV